VHQQMEREVHRAITLAGGCWGWWIRQTFASKEANFRLPSDRIDRYKCIETAERPSAHPKAPHSLTRMSVRVQDGQETQRVDVIELNVGV
jgi:hypothetical protein